MVGMVAPLEFCLMWVGFPCHKAFESNLVSSGEVDGAGFSMGNWKKSNFSILFPQSTKDICLQLDTFGAIALCLGPKTRFQRLCG